MLSPAEVQGFANILPFQTFDENFCHYSWARRLDPVHQEVMLDCLQQKDRNVFVMDIGIAASANQEKDRGITCRELAQKLSRFPNVHLFGLDRNLTGIFEMISRGVVADPPYSLPNLTYLEFDAAVELGVPPCSLDIALCHNVFYYLTKAKAYKIFISVFKALKVGGKFYCDKSFGLDSPIYSIIKTLADVEEAISTGAELPSRWVTDFTFHSYGLSDEYPFKFYED